MGASSSSREAPRATRPPPGATGTVFLIIQGLHFALLIVNANAAEYEQWLRFEYAVEDTEPNDAKDRQLSKKNVTVTDGPKPELRAGEKLLELGYTTRRLEEVEEPPNGFHKSTYNLIGNNSRCFCAHMCEFLGTAVLDNFKEVTRGYWFTGEGARAPA
jgi:hypothetical protein